LLAGFERRFGDDVIVVFTADHGEALGEHGLFFAHDFTLYDELTHVPLIVRLPGEAPARISTPVSLVDVLPTLCAYANLACPADLDGRKLTTDDARTAGDEPRAVFSAARRFASVTRATRSSRCRDRAAAGQAVRLGNEKLIRIPRPGSVGWEAYDLSADPAETHNVFDAARHARSARSSSNGYAQREAGDGRRRATDSALDRDTVEELRALGYLN
jgi:arylsulfatase A-like enzyme